MEKSKRSNPRREWIILKETSTFSPNGWPTYYSAASGIKIKDISGAQYIDFMMAVGANTLGYCDPYVNERVQKQ